jgi:hypothetical protein
MAKKTNIKAVFSHKKQAESAGKAGQTAWATIKEVAAVAGGTFAGAAAGRWSMAIGLPLIFGGYFYDNWLVRGIGTGMITNTITSAGLAGAGDEALSRMGRVADSFKKTTFIDKAQDALGLSSSDSSEPALVGLGNYYSARKPFAGFSGLGDFSQQEQAIQLNSLSNAYNDLGVPEIAPLQGLSGMSADGSII